MLGSRLLTGAGYPLKVPAIDLAEVGAGGGSILGSTPAARCRSAPTAPAPCRARSATTSAASEPTVTDANVVLGYLNPG